LSKRAFLALLLCLAACGFQLRGDPSVGLHAIFLSASVPSTVVGDVKRILATGATRVVANAADAEASLRITAESREKTVFTLTGQGRVYEYQLRLSATYELTVPGREEPVIAPTEVVSTRVITYNESAPTAKDAEEQLLYKDMQADVASRILRQVAVARRESPGAFAPRPQ
jgi:LPS-assembly lipoprotein